MYVFFCRGHSHECSTSHIIFIEYICRLLWYIHMQVGDNKKFTSVKESTNCPYYNEVPCIVTHYIIYINEYYNEVSSIVTHCQWNTFLVIQALNDQFRTSKSQIKHNILLLQSYQVHQMTWNYLIILNISQYLQIYLNVFKYIWISSNVSEYLQIYLNISKLSVFCVWLPHGARDALWQDHLLYGET